MTDNDPAKRYRVNLQGEIDSANLYRTLAEVEPDPQLATVYRRLAAVEEAHASFWQKRLAALDKRLPLLRYFPACVSSSSVCWPSGSPTASAT